MSTEENKAIVRRLAEAFNEKDIETLDEVLSPELAQSVRQIVPQTYELWGGHHIEITDLIAEGEKVVARVATSGRHTGEWLGLPPTNKEWTNTGRFFLRLENNKIVEMSSFFDIENHARQLGKLVLLESDEE